MLDVVRASARHVVKYTEARPERSAGFFALAAPEARRVGTAASWALIPQQILPHGRF